MTAEIKLLPLPAHFSHQHENVQKIVRAYARACVTHATAAKDAEIEALRAEVERLTRANGALTQLWESAGAEQNKAEARAERLAEALRELLALPIAEEELRRLDKGIGTATRNAAWLRARAASRSAVVAESATSEAASA